MNQLLRSGPLHTIPASFPALPCLALFLALTKCVVLSPGALPTLHPLSQISSFFHLHPLPLCLTYYHWAFNIQFRIDQDALSEVLFPLPSTPAPHGTHVTCLFVSLQLVCGLPPNKYRFVECISHTSAVWYLRNSQYMLWEYNRINCTESL